jgi:hypothetical protein
MKDLTISDAMKLVRSETAPAISIYLGTNVNDRDSHSKIRTNLQRLYKTAESLVVRTYDARARERLLQPLKKALANLKLSRSKGGVAIYHSETFTGIVRLPTAVADLAVAADSFHLKPVLRCAQIRRSYYILAIRKKYADLLRVTADGTRMVERVVINLKGERPMSDDDGSKRWLKDGIKIRRQEGVKEAMVTLHRKLDPYLLNDRLPLLLAGAPHYQDAFRAKSTYVNLIDRSLVGPIDELDMHAIAALSEGIMEQYFSAFDAQALVSFHRSKASGLASTNLKAIAKAAARGQVQSLLIAADRNVWGQIDRDTGNVRILDQRTDATADDLLDDIAELTLLKGGRVTVLPTTQMPEGGTIGAVLRWCDGSFPLLKHQSTGSIARPPRPQSDIGVSA